jgi:hypothetical protein
MTESEKTYIERYCQEKIKDEKVSEFFKHLCERKVLKIGKVRNSLIISDFDEYGFSIPTMQKYYELSAKYNLEPESIRYIIKHRRLNDF